MSPKQSFNPKGLNFRCTEGDSLTWVLLPGFCAPKMGAPQWRNDRANGWWWLCLYEVQEENNKKLLQNSISEEFDTKLLFYLWAAAVAAASIANSLMVFSSRYFCSQRILSASRDKMCSSFSRKSSCIVDTLTSDAPPTGWGCRCGKRKTKCKIIVICWF